MSGQTHVQNQDIIRNMISLWWRVPGIQFSATIFIRKPCSSWAGSMACYPKVCLPWQGSWQACTVVAKVWAVRELVLAPCTETMVECVPRLINVAQGVIIISPHKMFWVHVINWFKQPMMLQALRRIGLCVPVNFEGFVV